MARLAGTQNTSKDSEKGERAGEATRAEWGEAAGQGVSPTSVLAWGLGVDTCEGVRPSEWSPAVRSGVELTSAPGVQVNFGTSLPQIFVVLLQTFE